MLAGEKGEGFWVDDSKVSPMKLGKDNFLKDTGRAKGRVTGQVYACL